MASVLGPAASIQGGARIHAVPAPHGCAPAGRRRGRRYAPPAPAVSAVPPARGDRGTNPPAWAVLLRLVLPAPPPGPRAGATSPPPVVGQVGCAGQAAPLASGGCRGRGDLPRCVDLRGMRLSPLRPRGGLGRAQRHPAPFLPPRDLLQHLLPLGVLPGRPDRADPQATWPFPGRRRNANSVAVDDARSRGSTPPARSGRRSTTSRSPTRSWNGASCGSGSSPACRAPSGRAGASVGRR